MFFLSCASLECLFFLMIRLHLISTRTDTLFPYSTLFRSTSSPRMDNCAVGRATVPGPPARYAAPASEYLEQAGRTHAAANAHCHDDVLRAAALAFDQRSEEHTSELQSLMRRSYAVSRLKKTNSVISDAPTTHAHDLQ